MSKKIKIKCLRPLTTRGLHYPVGSTLEIEVDQALYLEKLDPSAALILEDVKRSGGSDNSNDGAGNHDTDNVQEISDLFIQIEGMEEDFIKQLIEMGIDSLEKLQACSQQDLEKVKGIGEATAVKLIIEIAEVELDNEED